MKINILLCDTFPGLLPDYIPSYQSMFIKLFDAVTTEMEYEVFPVWEGTFPDKFHSRELYLITGCNASVYDDTEWIKSLLEWIRQAHKQHIRMVGICFGHQAIAQALGGEVVKASQGWGTGIRVSRILDKEALSYFPDGEMRLLYNHHDQVVRLPKEADLVATSSFCVNESFRMANEVLTFQGHPEYTPEYARHLIEHHASDESSAVKAQALHSMDAWHHQGVIVARWIIDFFKDLSECKV